jgi:hypothetical protein
MGVREEGDSVVIAARIERMAWRVGRYGAGLAIPTCPPKQGPVGQDGHVSISQQEQICTREGECVYVYVYVCMGASVRRSVGACI